MANTYDVAPSDVAAELPGLFPLGFSTTTPVTTSMVTQYIATADSMVTLYIKKLASAAPALSDDAALIAKRFILNWAIAQVIRVAYAGQDAAASFSDPYTKAADANWDLLTTLGDEDTGTVTPVGPNASDFPIIASFRVSDTAVDEFGRTPNFVVGGDYPYSC